jgi:hypothetical protein
MRPAVYGYYENAIAFHKAASAHLVDGYVFHGQFQQGGVISLFWPNGSVSGKRQYGKSDMPCVP